MFACGGGGGGSAYDSEAQQKVKMIGAPDVSEITGKKMQ